MDEIGTRGRETLEIGAQTQSMKPPQAMKSKILIFQL